MQKIKYLDGLRGLAAVLVVFHHFMLAFYPDLFYVFKNFPVNNPLEFVFYSFFINIILNGNLQVCIFFILSGYVLSFKFFQQQKLSIVYSGAIRRYFRLAIPVFCSGLVAYFLLKFSLFFNKEAALITNSDWWLGAQWNFPANFLNMIKENLFGTFFIGKQLYKLSSTYNSSLWTMNYEFYGSFIVFYILFVLGIINRFRKTVDQNQNFSKVKFILVYSLPFIIFWDSYYLAFILGLMLSNIYNGRFKQSLKISNKLVLAVIFLLSFVFASYPPDADFTIYKFLNLSLLGISNYFVFYHIIGALGIMLLVLNSERLKQLLSSKFFVFLGQISFSIYLIHVPVIGSFSSYLIIKLIRFYPYAIAAPISIAGSFLLCVIISYFMYKYVDTKAVQFSSEIYQKVKGLKEHSYFSSIFNKKKIEDR